MKKIIISFLAVLLSLTVVHAQTNWISYKIDETISTKFPSEPVKAGPGTLIASNEDKSLICIFTVVDYKDFGLGITELDSIKDTEAFAQQVLTGLKSSLPKVNLSNISLGKWKGFSSYTTSGSDEDGKSYKIFMFIINGKMYSASTVSTSAGSKLTEQFTSSITLN